MTLKTRLDGGSKRDSPGMAWRVETERPRAVKAEHQGGLRGERVPHGSGSDVKPHSSTGKMLDCEGTRPGTMASRRHRCYHVTTRCSLGTGHC